MTHGDPIRLRARVAPDRPALIEYGTDRTLTYAGLDRLADAFARVLAAEHGVARGDRVAVLAANRLEQVALLVACARQGAVLVPLNWRLAAPERAAVLADADPRVVVVDPMGAELLRGCDAPPVLSFDDLDESVGRAGPPLPHAEADANAPLLLLYTSGSTGLPKGAVLTAGTLRWNAINTLLGWELGADDRTLVSAPLFHTGGWNVLTIPLLLAGGTVVLASSFDPEATLAAFGRYRLTAWFGVPAMFTAMRTSPRFADADLTSLRWVISGGAPCPRPEIEAWWARGVDFRQGYGLTEVGPNCFVQPPGDGLRRAGTVGVPMPFLETRVVDPAGEAVPPGAVGELQLRGPTVCAGYWNNPEATAAAIDEAGWFRTGDLFAVDADGAYRCVGRRKEMFISGGENVYPGEVERVLAGLPGVLEVAVVPAPDPRWGEVGHAFVAFSRGAELSDEDVVRLCRIELAGYKVPRRVTALPELPKGPTGKIHKPTLREIAAR